MSHKVRQEWVAEKAKRGMLEGVIFILALAYVTKMTAELKRTLSEKAITAIERLTSARKKTKQDSD